MEVVNDVDRPDVNGVPAKMLAIETALKTELEGSVPYLTIKASDNLMSNITIHGSMESKDAWQYNIFQNSTYFMFYISPEKGKRYYTEGENVSVEIISKKSDLGNFRKYTGPVGKVVLKIKKWIGDNKK